MNSFTGGMIVATIIIGTCFGAFGEHTTFYKQGQIDAITGNVKYELVKQPDGTTIWQRKRVVL